MAKKANTDDYQVKNLSVGTAVITPRKTGDGYISFSGVNGVDFVACCDKKLLKEIILEVGADECCKILGIYL